MFYLEPENVGRGLRQEFPMSPLLFSTAPTLTSSYTEELVREAAKELGSGTKVGGEWIKALRYSDDQALIARSQGDQQAFLISLSPQQSVTLVPP